MVGQAASADAQAFRRAVQSPRRGVGTATANRIIALAREQHDDDLIAASTRAHELDGIRQRAVRDRLTRFGTVLGSRRPTRRSRFGGRRRPRRAFCAAVQRASRPFGCASRPGLAKDLARALVYAAVPVTRGGRFVLVVLKPRPGTRTAVVVTGGLRR